MRGKLNYVRSDENSQTAQRSRDNGKTGGRRYGPRSQENAVSLEPRAEREHKEAKTLPLNGALRVERNKTPTHTTFLEALGRVAVARMFAMKEC